MDKVINKIIEQLNNMDRYSPRDGMYLCDDETKRVYCQNDCTFFDVDEVYEMLEQFKEEN